MIFIGWMKNKKHIEKWIAITLALGLWQITAMTVGQDLLLVSPLKVAGRFCSFVREADFWKTVGFSMERIVGGFLLAFLLGNLLAILAGRFSFAESLLWPYVITIKSVPVASFIIISLIWLKGEQLSVFISFLMVFPVIYSNVLEGIKSTDPKLLEMARLFRMDWGRKLLYIYLPAVRPYLTAACSVSLGMAWKSGVAAEVIGVINGSVGEKLYESKIYLMTADLLTWTVVIVLVSILFEKLFLMLLKMVFNRMERL